MEKVKNYSEIFSTERFEVLVDRKADELIVNDRELDITVSGELMLKNRHKRRLDSLIARTKEIVVGKDQSTTLKLDEYSEDKDPNLYVQLKMVKAWSLEEELNLDGILDTKLGEASLTKFADVVLKFNGVIRDKEVEEKK